MDLELGVHCRGEAINGARKLGLLPRPLWRSNHPHDRPLALDDGVRA